ncbi:MAG: glutamine--fructose-6-phosphate aminotransferase, partial [Cyclobacteriaceae bacterium]|nr:glutamine--fructose-6-phosphate aminotransferase [Cyclobacteriaceae bacterium]
MCGIVAYLGERNAYEIIIKGLKRLEYRGYDSAGIALATDNQIKLYKRQGKVSDLETYTVGKDLTGGTGIGHTRWATHGEPTDNNAHPHLSFDGSLSLIHNGVIENYSSLKQELISKGHEFRSETDSEVVIHFIEDIRRNNNCDLDEAVRLALTKIVGAYAIVIIDQNDPDLLIAARKSSPLVIGVGKGEYFIASDATPIIEYTKEVVYLNDHEIAVIRKDGLKLKNIEDVPTNPYIQTIDIELAAIEKGGFKHFMLKEIFEQPKSISDSMRGRLIAAKGHLVLGGIREYVNKLVNADRII